MACARGLTRIVRELLKLPSVNPIADNCIALRHACDYGHVEVVRLMLQSDSVRRFLQARDDTWLTDTIDAWSSNTFILTSMTTDFMIVRELLEHFCSVGEALYIVCDRNQDPRMIQLFLSHQNFFWDPTST